MSFTHSVKGKLLVLCVALSTAATVLVGVYFIFSSISQNQQNNDIYRQRLLEQFDQEIKLQTEELVSALDAVYNEQTAGKIDEATAKELAIGLIKSARYDNGQGYFFADDKATGVCVAHATLGKKVEGRMRINDQDSQGVYYMKEIFKAAENEGGGYSSFSFPKPGEAQDTPKRGYSMEFKPYGWIIATGAWISDYVDEAAAEYAANSQSRLTHQIIVSLFILLLIEIMIIFISSRVAKTFAEPISLATKRLEKFAQGDFSDKEINLCQRNDEIGEMSQAIEIVHKDLGKLLQAVHKSIANVLNEAKILSGKTDASSQSIMQVANSIVGVASSANEQLSAIDKASHAITQLAGGISNLAGSSQQAAASITKASHMALDGSAIINQADNQMALLDNAVNDSARVINQLGERSHTIGQIISTISGIASQTNLLALNAAIEAASAGEHGRGFSVVAEEVRKLAEQSQEAAKQIAAIIKEIQDDTETAVASMSNGTEQVALTKTAMQNAGKSFHTITELVENAANQAAAIASTVQEVSSNSDNIDTAIKNIDSMSRGIANESENVSASTEEQSASTEEISTAVTDLTKLAEDLQAECHHFKV